MNIITRITRVFDRAFGIDPYVRTGPMGPPGPAGPQGIPGRVFDPTLLHSAGMFASVALPPIAPDHVGCRVMLPLKATILRIAMDNHRPTIWYHADPRAPMEWRCFAVMRDGDETGKDGLRYLGSLVLPFGHGMRHLLEYVDTRH